MFTEEMQSQVVSEDAYRTKKPTEMRYVLVIRLPETDLNTEHEQG